MALWTWWHGDHVPELPGRSSLSFGRSDDPAELESITDLDQSEFLARINRGHVAYVAYVSGVPAAYGWVARLSAAIGELSIEFELEPDDRYLWDFVTLPEWRGQGIYPRLLQSILAQEGQSAYRFWIINAPENVASESGIRKAGFSPVGDLLFQRDFGVGAVTDVTTERARVGAAVLGVELIEALQSRRVVSPCWRCVIAASEGDTTHVPCWADEHPEHACDCVVRASTLGR